MGINKVLENGGVELKQKSQFRYLTRAIENSAKHVFGGVEMDDLPFSFCAALTYVLLFTGLFLGLLATTFQTINSSTHLSSDATSKDLNCDFVPKNISGRFFADLNGFWDTEGESYSEEKSLFVFEMNGESVDNALYTEAMKSFANNIGMRREQSALRPYWWNMVVLNSFGNSHGKSKTKFFLSTDAAFSFNTVVNVACLSSRRGVCVGKKSADGDDIYLSGMFSEAQAALTLKIPFKVSRASVFGNASNPNYQITFDPAKEEPCKDHGRFANSYFPQSVAEFRSGEGSLGFDVRSTILAIALNLNLVGFDTVSTKTSQYLRDLGLIAIQDTFYTFPPMARVYCLNKSAEIWSGKFSRPEMEEQEHFVRRETNTQGIKMVYPSICFVVSTRKNHVIQLFYPIISQFKTDRAPCTDVPAGCPKGTPTKPFKLLQCSCGIDPITGQKRDARNTDCNRQSIYFGYLYNVSNADLVGSKGVHLGTVEPLERDSAVAFAIEKQRQIYRLQTEQKRADYDMVFMDQFSSIFENTIAVLKNVDFADKSVGGKPSSAQLLADAWDSLGISRKNISAVIFRSIGVEGEMNLILPLNKFNVQMTDLVQPEPRYWDRNAGVYLSATMCKDAFNFTAALARMAHNPPVKLVEDYYRCKRSTYSTLVLSAGASFSFTNFITSALWTVVGFFAVQAFKRYLKTKGSRVTVVSHRAKLKLADMLQDIKDEAIAEAITTLQHRLDVLEGTSHESSSSLSDAAQKFDVIFGGNDTLGKLLSARANDATAREERQFRTNGAYTNSPPRRSLSLSPTSIKREFVRGSQSWERSSDESRLSGLSISENYPQRNRPLATFHPALTAALSTQTSPVPNERRSSVRITDYGNNGRISRSPSVHL